MALVVSSMPVMPVPGTKATAAVVVIDVGGVPFSVSPRANAIEKQEACAAASSSSGFVVPPDGSVRAFQDTSNVATFDVSSAVEPEPENEVSGPARRCLRHGGHVCVPSSVMSFPSCLRPGGVVQSDSTARRKSATSDASSTVMP